MEYPFSDDMMIFDKVTNRYILTENALLTNGIDFRARLAATANVMPEGVVEGFTRLVSSMVYGYIHQHSGNNMLQDKAIACLPSLRPIMFNAMVFQAIYVSNVGNLYLSPDPAKRALAMDELAKQELDNTVPELGTSICYVGA